MANRNNTSKDEDDDNQTVRMRRQNVDMIDKKVGLRLWVCFVFFVHSQRILFLLKLKMVVNGLVGRILLKFWWKSIKSVSIKFFIVCGCRQVYLFCDFSSLFGFTLLLFKKKKKIPKFELGGLVKVPLNCSEKTNPKKVQLNFLVFFSSFFILPFFSPFFSYFKALASPHSPKSLHDLLQKPTSGHETKTIGPLQ